MFNSSSSGSKKILITFFGMALSVSAYGQTTSEKASQIIEKTETSINKSLNKTSEIVTFKKGSAHVSNSEASSLRALVKSWHLNNSEHKIYVAAWADRELEKSNQKELSSSEIALAEKRAKAVETVLKGMKIKGEVVRINVAEAPGVFAQLIDPSKSNVQTKADTGDSSDSVSDNKTGESLHDKGGPRRVVVLLK